MDRHASTTLVHTYARTHTRTHKKTECDLATLATTIEPAEVVYKTDDWCLCKCRRIDFDASTNSANRPKIICSEIIISNQSITQKQRCRTVIKSRKRKSHCDMQTCFFIVTSLPCPTTCFMSDKRNNRLRRFTRVTVTVPPAINKTSNFLSQNT